MYIFWESIFLDNPEHLREYAGAQFAYLASILNWLLHISYWYAVVFLHKLSSLDHSTPPGIK